MNGADPARGFPTLHGSRPGPLQTLAALAESGFASLAEADLAGWAREVAESLGVDGVMIAFLEPPGLDQVRSQTFYYMGSAADQVCYLIAGTPCEAVIRQGPQVFPGGIQAGFPDDPMLPEWGIHAFAGAPIHSRDGGVLGLLSVFSAEPLSDPDLVLAGVRVLAARVGSEWDRLQRDRLLVAERRVLELISRDADLTRVLEGVVEEVERLDPEAIASVLLVEGDGRHLRAGPAPRLPAELQEAWSVLAVGPDQGSCGTAAYRKEPVIVTDIQADPLWASARELAAAHGIRACWSHPVLGRDGKVLATFAIYHRSPRRPAPTELEMARRVSDLVRLAVEHDRSRLALKESEARFRQLAEHLDAIFWLSDPQKSRLDYVSPAYARVWGRDPEELKADPLAWLESVHPEDRPGVAAAIWRQGDGTYDEEYRVLRPDGEIRWVADRAFPVQDGQGRVVRIAGLVRDITREKEADHQLEESRRRLQTLMDHLPGAAYRCRNDPAWTMEVVSAGILELTGYSPEEFLGSEAVDYGDLVHPEDRARVWAAVQEARDGTRSFEIVYRIVTRGGEVRWVQEKGRSVPGEEGVVEGFVSDITEGKEARDALRVSEERFQLLARATNDAIRDWDLETDALWWNEGVEVLTGDPPSELGASSEGWRDRIHPEDRLRVVGSLEETIRSGGSHWVAEYRFRRRDGTHAFVLDRSHVIRTGDGRAVRVIGGMTDLTERRALEQQLRESQKLESVGRLAGGIAHDFNNLLSVILGAVDLAMDSASRGASVEVDLKDIRRAADQAAQLTRQLLAFSRRQVLRPQVVDLNRLLGEMLSMLRRLIGTNVEMEFHPAPLPATARVDPGQMQQVLVNLVVNARDAMPEGGVLTLHVARHPGPDGGPERVEVVVGDTGEGMETSTLEHIFEPFFTTKEAARGTGLGLATVYGIVQQSGGTIGVESRPGQGTRFRIHLPLATDPAGS